VELGFSIEKKNYQLALFMLIVGVQLKSMFKS